MFIYFLMLLEMYNIFTFWLQIPSPTVTWPMTSRDPSVCLSCVLQETDRCEPNPCPQVCLDYGDRVACECSHGFTGATIMQRCLQLSPASVAAYCRRKVYFSLRIKSENLKTNFGYFFVITETR